MNKHVYQGILGAGTPIGLHDKHGHPVHLGDTLRFDPDVWYRHTRWCADLHGTPYEDEPDPIFTVRIVKGEIEMFGSPSDVGEYCEIICTWDDQL